MKKILVLCAIALAITGCDMDSALGLPKDKTIKYEITGTAATVNITMSGSDGGTEQIGNVAVPWNRSFTVSVEKGSYYFAYLSAQNNGTAGSVTVKIYADGDVFKQATSDGSFVITTVSGSVDY